MASRMFNQASSIFKSNVIDELAGSQNKQQQAVDKQVMEMLVEENR
jgi:hypothetical protein